MVVKFKFFFFFFKKSSGRHKRQGRKTVQTQDSSGARANGPQSGPPPSARHPFSWAPRVGLLHPPRQGQGSPVAQAAPCCREALQSASTLQRLSVRARARGVRGVTGPGVRVGAESQAEETLSRLPREIPSHATCALSVSSMTTVTDTSPS